MNKQLLSRAWNFLQRHKGPMDESAELLQELVAVVDEIAVRLDAVRIRPIAHIDFYNPLARPADGQDIIVLFKADSHFVDDPNFRTRPAVYRKQGFVSYSCSRCSGTADWEKHIERWAPMPQLGPRLESNQNNREGAKSAKQDAK